MQQRNVRALAWWGSAYLIGASGMALASMPDPIITLPPVVPGALTFLACGMIWNGVRLFQGRRLLPLATFIGAAIWLGVGQIPGVLENGNGPGHRGHDRAGLHVLHRYRALARTPQDTLFTCGGYRRAVPPRGDLFGTARDACCPA